MTGAIFPTLLEAALRAFAAAVVVWAALRLLRVRNVRTQKTAWTLTLLGALAMPLLMHWQWLPAGDAIQVSAISRALAPARAWMRVLSSPGTPAAAVPPGRDTLAVHAGPLPPAFAWSDPSPSHRSLAESGRGTNLPDFLAPPTVAYGPAPLHSDARTPRPAAAPPLQRRSLPVMDVVRMIYLAVASALLLRLISGLAVAWRLWTTAKLVPASTLAGLVPPPSVRWSPRLSSPANFGSGIVLPANYGEWSLEKLRVVLAHERAHVRQHDFYLQLLAGIYSALTWFSPLGWWLKRKLVELGEAMSDCAGLEQASSPSSYAQFLLEFAALPRPTPTGVAMARTGHLASRIERLLDDATLRQAFAANRRRAVVALAIAPAAFLASAALVRVQAAGQSLAPAQQLSVAQPAAAVSQQSGVSNPPAPSIADQGQDQSAPAPAPAPAAPPNVAPAPNPQPAPQESAPPPAPPNGAGEGAGAGEGQGAGAGAGQYSAPEPPPAPPAAGDVTVPPIPPVDIHVPPIPPIRVQIPPMPDISAEVNKAMRQMDAMRGNFRGDYPFFAYDRGDAWALVPAQGEPSMNVPSSGDQAEIDQARKTAHAPFFWFEHEGKSYVVEDPSIVAQIESMEKPIQDLRSRMRALGRQQRALGEQLRDKMRAQRQTSIPKPDLSRQMAELNADVDSLRASQGDTVSREQLMKLQRQVAELQGQIARAESGFYRQNGQWDAEMGSFGRQMGQLGSEQGRLAGEMARLSIDSRGKIDSVITQSLRDGKAKPVK
jgi:hypothetical protein